MSRGLADTSLFIAQEAGRPLDAQAIPDDLAVSIITIGELSSGVLAAMDADVRARRLRTLARALAVGPISVDHAVAEQWARLRVLLRRAGQRMPVNDSWIAATAIAWELPVVTQDSDYDVSITGLSVIRV